MLNFRIGFLSSIGGRLPHPCLPTPFPILRGKNFDSNGTITERPTGFKEGKSAINLSNLGGIFAKFGPGPFIYVRPAGGPENYLC